METPSQPYSTLPLDRMSLTVLRALLMGTAKPSPLLEPVWEAIQVLMPTTSPRRLTRAPPELPGLMAASVWM